MFKTHRQTVPEADSFAVSEPGLRVTLSAMFSSTTLGALVSSEGAPAVYTILSFPEVMVLDNQLMCTN